MQTGEEVEGRREIEGKREEKGEGPERKISNLMFLLNFHKMITRKHDLQKLQESSLSTSMYC